MNPLKAQFVDFVPSNDGPQADLILIEPNGDEHRVRCLCRNNGTTELGGDGEMVGYLIEKYGSVTVWGVARQVTLG